MKDLENNSEKLELLRKELPFKVPEGYFDELPARIQNLCVGEEKEKTQVSLFQLVKAQMSLAAGFIILVGLALAGYYFIKPPADKVMLTNDDYIEIVEKHITDFDEGHLLNAVKDSREIHTPSNDMTEEMIRYLLKENLDYVTLMEEY